jgi:hypothetical protein
MDVAGRRKTVIQTDDGHWIGVQSALGLVQVNWLGPRHAELEPWLARHFAFVLRTTAQEVEPFGPATSYLPGNEPGS